jgi:sterol desaturase/sphingolipid hydroxylase (fatty acid hydroxylase superfamily)
VTDRAAIRTDILYTVIHRLGLFRLAMFFLLAPLMDGIEGHLRLLGWQRVNVEDWWPGVTSMPLISFFVYLRCSTCSTTGITGCRTRTAGGGACTRCITASQMTLWSDNRNHLLDDILRDFVFAAVALAVGVEPSQYVLLVALSQLLQSLQHANLRLHFGWLGERLLISPRFHRTHHAVGLGHEKRATADKPARLGGCNYGVIFPWWDMLFGTADFTDVYHPPASATRCRHLPGVRVATAMASCRSNGLASSGCCAWGRFLLVGFSATSRAFPRVSGNTAAGLC